MAEARHKLPFNRVKFPIFGTPNKLADDVLAERDFWVELGLQPFREIDYQLTNPNYDVVVELARKGDFEVQHGRTNWRETFIFPHRRSVEGLLLKDLLTVGLLESARNLVFAIHVEEDWINLARYRNDWRGATGESRAAEGRSLLAMARLGYVRRDREAVANLQWERERLSEQAAEIDVLERTSRDTLAAVQEVHQWTVERSRRKLNVLGRWQKAAVKANNKKRDSQFRNWQMDWEATRASFVDELRYRAPIAHWDTVSRQHERRANLLLGVFVATMIGLALASYQVAWVRGDDIAAAFKPTGCPSWVPACVTAISPKGPIVVGSILLCSSLAIWLLRMLSRMHLSERHLARAAAEKRSFTEAFLALRKEHSVSEAQEAIVMGSIFRPSQDGFVSDDDGGVDLTGPALLARAFSGKQ